MPNGEPTFSLVDGDTRVDIDIDNQADKPIRVHLTGPGVGVGLSFSLSIVGAQRFDVMLSAAITRAINNR